MERPRLLAFDLDRTLLTEDYRLPLLIERAVLEARREGNIVTVLTGRPRAATIPYLDQLEIRGPYSVNHGGTVYGPSGEVVRTRRLESSLVADLLRPYQEVPDLDFSCIVDDVLYVRDPNDDRWAWAHTRNRVVRRLEPNLALDAEKVVFAADDRTGQIDREIRARLPHLVTYLWGDGYLEITGPDSDKGGALRLIAELLEVAQEDTVAFGDGLNDVTMLSWAGHSVAVGEDAHPDAVAVASERIATPEEGGVAHWLAHNLGIELNGELVDADELDRVDGRTIG